MAKKTKRKGRHDQAQAQPVADAAGNQRASAVSELFSGTDLAGSAPPVSELSFLTAVHTLRGLRKRKAFPRSCLEITARPQKNWRPTPSRGLRRYCSSFRWSILARMVASSAESSAGGSYAFLSCCPIAIRTVRCKRRICSC
jgi:hypothetical protein